MRVYYEKSGSGLPLLSISGSGSALPEGSKAAGPFESSCEVVEYDHRGLGRSLGADGPTTMADYASDALELADLLGWDRFAVFGLSFGGMVALHVAIMAPDRVSRLALACTSAGGPGGSSYPLHNRPADEELALLMDTRPEVAASFLALGAGRIPPAEPGATRQLEARRLHNVWESLPAIVAPTFVGSGRYDGIAPAVNSERIAAAIPGAVHRTFEGGHAFLWQDPQAFPAYLEFFNAGLVPTGGSGQNR